LHDLWSSLGLVHYIYILGVCLLTEFCQVQIQFASKSCVLLYWQLYCTTLQHQASAKRCAVVQGMELQNFRRGRHLYSAGRPSRCTSVHILVLKFARCKFSLRPSLAFSYIGSFTAALLHNTPARHSSSGRQPNSNFIEIL